MSESNICANILESSCTVYSSTVAYPPSLTQKYVKFLSGSGRPNITLHLFYLNAPYLMIPLRYEYPLTVWHSLPITYVLFKKNLQMKRT